MFLKRVLLTAAFAVTASFAQAAAVDFEGVLTDQFGISQTHDGFDWEFSASGWFVGPHDAGFCPDCTSNGTSNLVAAGDRDNDTARVLMTKNGGGVFDLGALDAATANSTETNRLGVLGTFFGGGTILAFLDIDGTFDSFTLAGFVNLESVLFFSEKSGNYNFGGFSIDNLDPDAATIPVPAALPLMLVAMGGLGVFARRRKTT